MAGSGKRIVLTGATRGLGLALAERFIEAGHTVLACGRTESAIEKLQRRHPSAHDFAVVDVADWARVSQWAERLLAEHEPPDLLINNAALINRNARLWELESEEVSQLFAVNVLGVTNVIRAFAPSMVARRHGVIVNFSSTWGRVSSPEVATYCASKFAIEGLTLALAQELPRGMAAVPFNPGVIDTQMLCSCFGEAAGDYPNAEEWSRSAAPFLLELGPHDNGQSLTAP